MPLTHLAVWEVCDEAIYYKAVTSAVQCIMSQPVPTSNPQRQYSILKGASFFFITEDSAAGRAEIGVHVYALTGMQVSHYGINEKVYGDSSAHGVLVSDTHAPEAQPKVPLSKLFQQQAVAASDTQNNLGMRIAAALKFAVSNVSVNGKAGVMKTRCVSAYADSRQYGVATCDAVWVVEWQI